jgi:hypothetical protein
VLIESLERHSFRFFWATVILIATLTVGGC